MLDRREFVQRGLGAGVLGNLPKFPPLMAILSLFLGPLRRLSAEPLPPLRYLRARDLSVLEKILPVAVGLERETEHRTDVHTAITSLDRLLVKLSVRNRNKLLTLLDLLSFAPARILLGLWPTWAEANRNEIDAMLKDWQGSRLQTKRLAYQSLVQVLQFAWYSSPVVTHELGYPGPPEAIRPFLKTSVESPDGLQ